MKELELREFLRVTKVMRSRGEKRVLLEWGRKGTEPGRERSSSNITAFCDNLSSYLFCGTHSNGVYLRRKCVRGMGMGGNRSADLAGLCRAWEFAWERKSQAVVKK